MPKSEPFFNVLNIRQDDGQYAEVDRARPLLSDQLPGEQQGEPRGKQGMEILNTLFKFQYLIDQALEEDFLNFMGKGISSIRKEGGTETNLLNRKIF